MYADNCVAGCKPPFDPDDVIKSLKASIGVIMVSEHLLAVNLYITLCAEILLLTKEDEQYENGDDISEADRLKARTRTKISNPTGIW